MNAVTKGLYTETPKEQYPLLTTRCMVSGNSKRWAEQGGFTVEAFSHVKRFAELMPRVALVETELRSLRRPRLYSVI